jgi:arylsulfatase A-like enzyme
MYGRLHKLAVLLLAAGFAVQTARLVATHAHFFRSVVSRTTKWVVALLVGVTASAHVWQILGERNALARLPLAPPNAPNVLLIVLDTVRAQSLSLYNYARPTTPQLEQLATTGVTFERALSTAPWTLPAHASMFTGRFPHELSADWLMPLEVTSPTLAEVFNEHGYVTAGFVANLIYGKKETGLARGFVHYKDFPTSIGMVVESSWLTSGIRRSILWIIGIPWDPAYRKNAAQVNEEFLRWLSRKNQRPFFVFLNYFDAHLPYVPPKPFDAKFELEGAQTHRSLQQERSPRAIQARLDAYEGAIAYLDHHFGLLINELRKRELLENTLIIITSDHGELIGEHGLFEHGNSLYRPLLHIPLLISFPRRVPHGIRVREPVVLRDLPTTVADLVGFHGEPRFPGNSLARYWSNVPAPDTPITPLLSEVSKAVRGKEEWPASKGDMKSLVVEGMHYIKHSDGREELYDFENDVREERDLATSEEGHRLLGQIRLVLNNMMLTHSRPLR